MNNNSSNSIYHLEISGYRGYYMASRGYEFYVRVLKRTSERYFPHEKIKFVSQYSYFN